MADTRGVFTLQEIIPIKLEEQWVALSDVWIAPSPFIAPVLNTGYFGGGSPGTLDKINYSTDTKTTIPGQSFRTAAAATGNSITGYIGGDYSPAFAVTTMNKITYSSDLTAAVPGAALSAARIYLGATGNETAGYFGGGTGNVTVSTMDRTTYSSETTVAVPGAALSAARNNLAATGNQTAGYFGGGSSYPNYFSTIDKIQYSTNTRIPVPGANLSVARYGPGATGNSTAGYFGGGSPGVAVNPGINQTSSIMDKVTYSTDTRLAVPGANLSVGRYSLAATGNTTNGYFGGGGAPPGPGGTGTTTMDKIEYSTDTRLAAIPGVNLSGARYYPVATSAKANALPQLTYFNPAPSAASVRYSDNFTSPANTGYFGGGFNLSSVNVSTMEKVTYTSDTTAQVPGAALSSVRRQLAATGNNNFGYFGGGSGPATPFYASTMDKVTYSTDTTLQVPGASLSAIKYSPAATGTSTAGYFGGGYTSGGNVSTMDKIDYATDTRLAAIPGAALSSVRHYLAATGNSTNGYFGGGISGPGPVSTMDKIDYATDTRLAAIPGASLSIARHGVAATGNSTNGYFGGGFPGSNPAASTMDKIQYSTDTRLPAIPGANLSGARYVVGATGNSTAGYFGGGASPGPTVLSTMDKVNYSTDTTAASPGASLTVTRRYLAASSARANALPVVGPPATTPTPGPFIV